MYSYSDSSKVQKFIRLVMIFLAIVIIVTITLAILAYPEPYEFFNEAISNLGATKSETGLDNYYSMLIMIIGFWVIAGITFVISLIYLIKFKLKHNFLKALWMLGMTVGAVGVSIPLDLFPKIHYAGAILFVFCFGMFNLHCQVLRYSRKHRPQPNRRSFDYWLDAIVAWLLVFFIVLYFVVFVLTHVGIIPSLEWLNVALAQKLVLIIALIAILLMDPDDM